MPTSHTYPGVYIEETPSGVRTITGVATSIAAFVGRAACGPTDVDAQSPLIINSYDEFERNFGKLDPAYPMSYAVRDFYLNGGSQAAVVRLYKADDNPSANASAAIKIANLPLEAASVGSWGNQLRARIDTRVSADIAARYGLDSSDLFNLTLCDMASGKQETFSNLTVKDSPRRVDQVLKAGSTLARVSASLVLPATVTPAAQREPDIGKTVWNQDTSSTGVVAADKGADSAALDDAAYLGDADANTGLYALKKTDLFNLLCIPPDVRQGSTSATVYQHAMVFCVERRAMLLVDAPAEWNSASALARNDNASLTALGLAGVASRNAALFFPRVIQSDPMRQGELDTFVPCGILAGVMARSDAQRGVWKAPAGLDAGLRGVQGLAVMLTDVENDILNPLGINCLRSFPRVGPVVWGSRTLRGADLIGDDYKYVAVRRLALYIEESLFRGTRWTAFEPNDEALWTQVRLNVDAFMHTLFCEGALQGKTSREAYFVQCDNATTTRNEINLGIVNIVVGFAPLKPAEFVVIKLQQVAGQSPT